MKDIKIEVDLSKVERGALKGFADVTFILPEAELTVKGFRIVQKDGKPPWVALPTSSYEKGGKIVNKKLFECSRKLLQLIQETVLAVYGAQASSSDETKETEGI